MIAYWKDIKLIIFNIANIGRAYYTGDINNYNFEKSFKGDSSVLEGDYIIGTSISFSAEDEFQKMLIMYDMGIGAGIGGSTNIGSRTYKKKIFNFWWSVIYDNQFKPFKLIYWSRKNSEI